MTDTNLPPCMYTHQSARKHGSRAAPSAYFFLVSPKPSSAPLGKLHFKIISFALEEVE